VRGRVRQNRRRYSTPEGHHRQVSGRRIRLRKEK
jgi:hypothetical protein